ncbi:hypothetical protein [Microvirga ossetica]|nr:hypothetical protein [Microvirga ossetica]
MPQPQAMAASAPCPALDADWIEQKIIRAYVRLAMEPHDMDGCRVVTLVRHSSLEVRLMEVPSEGMAGMPTLWLELRSQMTGATIDSLGCYEFDEDELSAAVMFVQDATHRLPILH